LVSKEQKLYREIIWFHKKVKFDIDFFDLLQPQRIVSEDPRYNSGKIFSEKCQREIQYESGMELAFIKQLEQLKNVKFYYEQPVQIQYIRGRKKQTYTPDFGVLLDTNEFFIVEIKDLCGMLENKVQMKIEGLMDFCSKKGFGLLLTDGKNTINKIKKIKCNRKLEKEILSAIAGNILRKKQCDEIMKRYKSTQPELLKIILKNNLKYRSFPFKLQHGNRNEIFHRVFFENKSYSESIILNF